MDSEPNPDAEEWDEDDMESEFMTLLAREKRQDDVRLAAQMLSDMVHRSFPSGLRRRYILFRFQRAPMSRAGAKCYLPHCHKRIWPGEYRIKLDRPDCRHELIWGTYHIDCFEELLDLTSPAYALRFEPDLRYHPGLVELCILREYTRRWLARLNITKLPVFHTDLSRKYEPKIPCEQYFPTESAPAYDERHILSSALRNFRDEGHQHHDGMGDMILYGTCQNCLKLQSENRSLKRELQEVRQSSERADMAREKAESKLRLVLMDRDTKFDTSMEPESAPLRQVRFGPCEENIIHYLSE